MDKSKLDYLIKYLEAIVNNIDFRIRDSEEHKNYTTLLLNCYIMQENFEKLKNFVESKGSIFSQELIKSIINICLDTERINLALEIAKNFKLVEEYLRIIIKLNKYEEAINILEYSEKHLIQITNQDKINLFNKFGKIFF